MAIIFVQNEAKGNIATGFFIDTDTDEALLVGASIVTSAYLDQLALQGVQVVQREFTKYTETGKVKKKFDFPKEGYLEFEEIIKIIPLKVATKS